MNATSKSLLAIILIIALGACGNDKVDAALDKYEESITAMDDWLDDRTTLSVSDALEFNTKVVPAVAEALKEFSKLQEEGAQATASQQARGLKLAARAIEVSQKFSKLMSK